MIDRYNVQLDLRPFFAQRGEKSAVAQQFGLNPATIGLMLNEPPLSLATALATERDSIRRRLLAEPRPFLIPRKRGWPIPEQIEKLDRKFRQSVGLISFTIVGNGSLTLNANEIKEPEPEPEPSAELAIEALRELCTRLVLERDEAVRDAAAKAQRLSAIEPEYEALKTRVRDAERMAEEAVVRIPAMRDVRVPVASIAAATRLVPSLTRELAQLPKM